MRTLRLLVLSTLLLSACGQETKMVETDPPSLNFTTKDQSGKVKATALDISGKPIKEVPITFRSENTAIAEVTPDGTVTPTGDGMAAIIASSPEGIKGETFVKVCLPKDIICDPPLLLNLRVGTAAPLKCHLIDCKEEKLTTAVQMVEASADAMFKDDSGTVTSFVGKVVGDTSITVKSGGLEKIIKVRIDEQIFAPGMEPGSGGGGGGGGEKKSDDPYKNEKGRYNHIIGNMKF